MKTNKDAIKEVRATGSPQANRTGRGGGGRGQGRHFHAVPIQRLISIRFHPEDEADYQFMLLNTDPAERFAILLAAAKRKQADAKFIACVKAQTASVGLMLAEAEKANG